MAVSATAKNTGISVKKFLPLLDLVRGRGVDDALDVLGHMPSPAAAQIAKVVKSASANAENELLTRTAQLLTRTADLRIVEIYANEGTSLKRFRARARGRAGRVERRNSHVTVVVDEQEGSRGQ